MSLRLAFMGTPDFAVPALAAILKAGHPIETVYTRPPRPAGRGLAERRSPVHRLAAEHGLAVRTPDSLKTIAERDCFAGLKIDAVVVVAYGLILPKSMVDGPRLGAFNIHASLLPRWRGAAPIARAIMEGDAETGIAIMRMAEGLDTGPVCLSEAMSIAEGTTAGELHDRLAVEGAAAQGHAYDRKGRVGGDGAGEVGGHARAADEGDVPVVSGAACHLDDGLRRAVCGQDSFVGLESELLQGLDGGSHLVPVVGRAHQDCDLHVPSLAAFSAMSVRCCLPGQRMRSTAA